MMGAVTRRLLIAAIASMSFVGTTFAMTISSSSPSAPQEPLSFNMLQRNIAYIRLGLFTQQMTDRIRPTMTAIAAKKPRGIIIDLRNSQGGDVNLAYALLNTLLPKGTPYLRITGPTIRSTQFTREVPLIKKSTPVVVMRGPRTRNEADIIVYVLQKIRHAGVLEFSDTRDALVRAYKQHARMEYLHPIKEGIFFVSPDARIIATEGGGEEDMIPRAISLVREMSPWDEVKK